MTLHILLLCWVAISLSHVRLVLAVRGTVGCYDDYPMSCNEHKVSLEEMDMTLDELDDICHFIENHLLGSLSISTNVELHPDYLNAIEATDEYCPLVQQAYSHCSLCYSNFDDMLECQQFRYKYRNNKNCTGLPTREEILKDNQNYPMFQTDKDITEACDTLLHAYRHWGTINVMDLCEKQKQILHLCPGNCMESCFDPVVNPPLCNAVSSESADAEQQKVWDDACFQIHRGALFVLDNEQIFNTSLHLEFLEHIPGDYPNCSIYRQAYSRCFWCQSSNDLCFDQDRPPTCSVPDSDSIGWDDSTTKDICDAIYMDLIPTPYKNGTSYDLSYHAKHSFYLDNTTTCDQRREAYHKCIWCDSDVPDFDCVNVDVCDVALDFSLPDGFEADLLTMLDMGGITERDCTFAISNYLRYYLGSTLESCYERIALTRICHKTLCQRKPKNLKEGYLGTSSSAQRKALIWVSRSSAILSFLGASYILCSIFSDPKARQTVYHQILIGMATFDIVTALSWSLATLPIDKNNASHVEGAMGSEGTCTAQAFFIQLGFSSVFYNVSLAVYYVLVIACSWREFQLQKIRIYLHAFPLVLGFGLAFGAIPSYHVLEYGCHLSPPPDGQLWSVLVFVVLPLGLSIIAIIGCMGVVYWSVRQQAEKAKKWKLGANQTASMQRAVFWQCLSYILAFSITWPIMFAVYLFSVDEQGPFGLAIVVAFVAPLQGFSNFVVFMRSKKMSLQKKKSRRPGIHRIGRLSTLFRTKATSASSKTPEHECDDEFHDEGDHEEDSLHGMDPSSALPLQRDRISERWAKLSAVRDQAPEEKQNGSETSAKGSRDTPNLLANCLLRNESEKLEVFSEEEEKQHDHDQVPEAMCMSNESETGSASRREPGKERSDTPTQLTVLSRCTQTDSGSNHDDFFRVARSGSENRSINLQSLGSEDDQPVLYPVDHRQERKDWSKYLLH